MQLLYHSHIQHHNPLETVGHNTDSHKCPSCFSLMAMPQCRQLHFRLFLLLQIAHYIKGLRNTLHIHCSCHNPLLQYRYLLQSLMLFRIVFSVLRFLPSSHSAFPYVFLHPDDVHYSPNHRFETGQ